MQKLLIVKKYGNGHNIRAEINRRTGNISFFRVKDDFTQIPLEDARDKKEGAKLGDGIHDPLPPIDLVRVAAKQVASC